MRRITPKRLRCISSLHRRTLMRRSTAWAACTSEALPKTTLKRCGCTSLLPPKDILMHYTGSLAVTRKGEAFVKTRPKPFAGSAAHKQRVTLMLQSICVGCARDSYSSHSHTRQNKSLRRPSPLPPAQSCSSTNSIAHTRKHPRQIIETEQVFQQLQEQSFLRSHSLSLIRSYASPAPTPVVACVSCCDTPPYSSGFSSVGRSRCQSWTLQKMGQQTDIFVY